MSCKNDIDGALLGNLSQHGDLPAPRSSSSITSRRARHKAETQQNCCSWLCNLGSSTWISLRAGFLSWERGTLASTIKWECPWSSWLAHGTKQHLPSGLLLWDTKHHKTSYSELRVTFSSVVLHFASTCLWCLAMLVCTFWELWVIMADGLSLNIRELVFNSSGTMRSQQSQGSPLRQISFKSEKVSGEIFKICLWPLIWIRVNFYLSSSKET